MRGLAEAAARLRSLHSDSEPLVLANAWDAAWARSVVAAGFAAVATTSVGVSGALGWNDGEATPPSGAKVAWFKDPDGNTLSITQRSPWVK